MSDDKPPAVLLQHPSAPVKLAGYIASPASNERGKVEAAKERAEVDAACKAYDQERHAAILVLTEMVDLYGHGTVRRWLRNISLMADSGPIGD